jgi:hypothetical protein
MRRDDDAFDDRKKSQEAKYKMDEERRFKVRSRRNKLTGLWAAERLGLAGEAAAALAADIVMMGLDARSDVDFRQTIARHLAGTGGTVGEADIAEALVRLEGEASRQIAGEFPAALDGDHRPVGDGPLGSHK